MEIYNLLFFSKYTGNFKIKISESEASETVYWLEIIDELNWMENNLFKPVYEESNELLAIFTLIKKINN